MPVVWKDAVLHQQGEAPEDQHDAGLWRWAKPMTRVEWPKFNGLIALHIFGEIMKVVRPSINFDSLQGNEKIEMDDGSETFGK